MPGQNSDKRAVGGPGYAHLQHGGSYTMTPLSAVQKCPKNQSPLTQAQSTTCHALGSTPVFPSHVLPKVSLILVEQLSCLPMKAQLPLEGRTA